MDEEKDRLLPPPFLRKGLRKVQPSGAQLRHCGPLGRLSAWVYEDPCAQLFGDSSKYDAFRP